MSSNVQKENYDRDLHPLDILMCCYAASLGIEQEFTFLKFLETLVSQTSNTLIIQAITNFLDANNHEQKEKIEAEWKPTLKYVTACVKLLNVISECNELKNNANRDELVYALKLLINEMYLLRKTTLTPRNIYYRGVLLPVALFPTCSMMIEHGESKINAAYGEGKFQKILANIKKN